MSSVIISLILFSFTIITFLPIGAHNVGSEAPPNNTILAILWLLQATNKCIGPVSFPKTSFAPEDKYAKSEKLVLPIKLTTEWYLYLFWKISFSSRPPTKTDIIFFFPKI